MKTGFNSSAFNMVSYFDPNGLSSRKSLQLSRLIAAARRLLRKVYPRSRQRPINTQQRDELIRKKYLDGQGLSDLAREYRISPQRVFQIVKSTNS